MLQPFGLPNQSRKLPHIDIMCRCGHCEFGKTGACTGTQPKPTIDEAILNTEVSRFLSDLYHVTDNENPPGQENEPYITFLKYFSSIQILKENEAITAAPPPPQMNDNYFTFCSLLIKQYNNDFHLRHLRFHYVFDAMSECYGFLNNYLNTPVNECIVGLTYREGKCFRSKGSVEKDKHLIFSKADYTDYFAIAITDNRGNENVVLIDIFNKKAHVLCQRDEMPFIIRIMSNAKIQLSNPTFITFEGEMHIKTNILLFRYYMAYYLQIPALSKIWTMMNPEKSINSYIFRLATVSEVTQDNTPTGKIYEYVKMTIEPRKKVDMINNIFCISFNGNDKTLLLPFIASLTALMMRLENIKFIMSREMLAIENEFTRRIQRGDFDIDRQTLASCATRVCKKRSFIDAFNSLTRREGVENEFLGCSINYRPLAVHYPMLRMLDGTTMIDTDSILSDAIFLDSIGINPIFAKNAKHIKQREHIYTKNYQLNDFTPKHKGVIVNIQGNDFSVYLQIERSTSLLQNVHLLNFRNHVCLLDYPLEGNLKGLDKKGQRKVNKTHSDKLAPLDSFIHEILLRYGLQTDENNHCSKLIIFSEELLQYSCRDKKTLLEYARFVLGNDENIGTLLSQHLWDYSLNERVKFINEINVELQQDLLQYLFNARILYFVFDQRDNVYKFREPRFNGWYAINNEYKRVMFVFKAKNENFYTCLFSIPPDAAAVAAANRRTHKDKEKEKEKEKERCQTYSIPITAKIKEAHMEVSFQPDVTDRRNNLLPYSLDDDRINGQLIDSYGKSVGVRIGNQIHRYIARAPFIMPEQRYAIVGDQHTKMALYTATWFSVNNRFTAIKEEHRAEEQTELIQREDYVRQTRQHFSVLIKCIIKYILSTNVDLLSNKELENLLHAIIVERQDDIPLYTDDKIYKLVKMPFNGIEQFLNENYPSVFRNGVFRVKGSMNWKRFIFTEIRLIRIAPPSFETEFLESDLDILLVKQEKDEILSMNYLEHDRSIVSIRKELSSNPDIRFYLNVTHEILARENIILVKIEQRYYLLRQTESAEIETACFVSELWRNRKEIADYDEARILTIGHQLFHLDKGGKIIPFQSSSTDTTTGIHILQFFPRKRNEFASLLPV